ncbi:hypothetical protein ACFRCG_47320 [Embleya sp. NPDC056575]|uniref:hypothetical protein n=1 Tax=unclassified Embleya TaxID=2699296 RepID=UPI0036D1FE36
MSFNGDLILMRPNGFSISDMPFMECGDHRVAREADYTGGWKRFYIVHDDAPYIFEMEWLEELSRKAGSPALACHISEDSAFLSGVSKAGRWSGWITPHAAAVRLAFEITEELPIEIFDEYGNLTDPKYFDEVSMPIEIELEAHLPALAESLAQWTRDSELQGDVEIFTSCLRRRDAATADGRYFELLHLMGLSALSL